MRKWIIKTSIMLLIVFAAATSIVMVDETEYVIVERLGRISAVYDTIDSRGLHFKAPWPIDIVRRFDSRMQLFDPVGRELFTRDRKNITVDPFVCWQIAECTDSSISFADRPVVRFFQSLSTSANAQSRLDSQLRSVMTAEVGRVELDQLLSVSDSTTGPGTDDSALNQLSRRILNVLQQELRQETGLTIVDAQIKRLNFPQGNQQSVFERMKSERRKIASRYRSAGLAESQVIKSQADRQYNEIMARAKGEATRIRGEAEAEAMRLLTEAHSRDPEFFELMRTLESYKSILGDRTTLVLSASSNLFRLLTDGLEETTDRVKPNPPTKTADDSGKVDVSDATERKP